MCPKCGSTRVETHEDGGSKIVVCCNPLCRCVVLIENGSETVFGDTPKTADVLRDVVNGLIAKLKARIRRA